LRAERDLEHLAFERDLGVGPVVVEDANLAMIGRKDQFDLLIRDERAELPRC